MTEQVFLLEQAEKTASGREEISRARRSDFSVSGNELGRRYFHCRLHDSQNPVYRRETGQEVCILRLIDTEFSTTIAVMVSTSFYDSAPKE